MYVDVHKKIAKMLGLSQEQIEQILQGIESIDISQKEKALLEFYVRASKKR